MRIRTIKPEFWTHPVLSRLDDGARLMAVGLLNLADDEGFFLAHPTLVRNALRAFDEDSTNTRRALETLLKVGYIEVREHPEQGQVGLVVNFLKHQRIDRPTPSKIAGYWDSTSPRRALDEPSLLEGKGKEGKGSGNGTRFAAPSQEEVDLECARIGLPPTEGTKFVAFYASKGWKVGKSPMKDWRMALVGWRTRWEEYRNANTQRNLGNGVARHRAELADNTREAMYADATGLPPGEE